MRPRVLIFGGPALLLRATHTLRDTAAIVLPGGESDLHPPPDCALFAVDVDDTVVRAVAATLPKEQRHCLLAVRGAHARVDVEWTVIADEEVERALVHVVEDIEAVSVELLARIRIVDDGGSMPRLVVPSFVPSGPPLAAERETRRPSRFGCVVSVSSRAIICAIDDVVRRVVVAFVLPGTGPIEVRGTAQRVPGRPGLVRVSPEEDSVRERLLEFTRRRGRSELTELTEFDSKLDSTIDQGNKPRE